MMLIRNILLGFLIGISAVQSSADDSNDLQTVVAGNAGFACDLYGQLRSKPGNIFISPYNISTALMMMYAGARGETAAQMAKVLHMELSREQLHPVFGRLQKQVSASLKTGQVDWLALNAVWVDQSTKLLPEYDNFLRQQYGTPVTKVDFRNNAAGAWLEMDGWVSKATKNRITKLFDVSAITPDTRLILASAVYFKGRWWSAFKRENTQPDSFFVQPTKPVRMSFMTQTQKFPYKVQDGVEILALPYMGKNVFLIVVLPRDFDGLAIVEEGLTPEKVAGWVKGMPWTEIEVHFPRFSTQSNYSLGPTLAKMGMPGAFDQAEADFSGMTQVRELYLQEVVHRTEVTFDEEGTTATAATAVLNTFGAESEKPKLILNHPFLYFVYDDTTCSILFMGRLTDPTK